MSEISEGPLVAEHVLEAVGYRAAVTTRGAALRELTHQDVPLVRGFALGGPQPVHSGSILAPWPNRVRDGRWVHHGTDQQLCLTEPDRGTALHGLVEDRDWDLVSITPTEVVLATELVPAVGWPVALGLQVRYSLGGDGLTTTLVATGRGPGRVPYGCGIHPWLVAPTGRVEDWSLQLDASEVLPVDPQRLLPTGPTVAVDGTFDLRGGPVLGSRCLDHAWTRLSSGTARLRGPSGRGVRLDWDPARLPWVQVCTGERPEPELHRTGIAVEPMSCPPDALRSGTDLVHLDAGQTHLVWWRMSFLNRPGS